LQAGDGASSWKTLRKLKSGWRSVVAPAGRRVDALPCMKETEFRMPQEAPSEPLALRLRQQELLAELGVLALKGTRFLELMDRAALMVAEGLQAEFAKVTEYLPAENRFLVRAGVGWKPGTVGVATVGADLDSPAGFALHTGEPVISNHLQGEQRFRTPDLLLAHGIRRAVNVIVQGEGRPFGVLEVDSRSAGEFSKHDVAFLQGAANLLGMAIERQRIERDLQAALDHRDALLMEVNHRVANSLQLVISMLRLKANAQSNATVREHLQSAMNRVAAISRVHRRLYQSGRVQHVNLPAYLVDICADLSPSLEPSVLEIDVPPGFEVATDRAIPIALIVAELATNAAKYAYPSRAGGKIFLRVSQPDTERLIVSVRDEGIGLPSGFDPRSSDGLGMRIMTGFADQLGGTFEMRAGGPGTEAVLRVPILGPERDNAAG
jgi:two-component sensor histidine kinase